MITPGINGIVQLEQTLPDSMVEKASHKQGQL